MTENDVTVLTPRVRKAIDLIKIAHAGQFRKDGKTRFDSHPIAVMWYVRKYVSQDNEQNLIGTLGHDCLEDIEDFDLDHFVDELYGDQEDTTHLKERVKEIILALTKNDTLPGRHEKDVDSYNRIQRAGCVPIKLCDRLHNISDMEGMSNAHKVRYIAETHFMLGFFKQYADTEIYKELLRVTEKRMNEITQKIK